MEKWLLVVFSANVLICLVFNSSMYFGFPAYIFSPITFSLVFYALALFLLFHPKRKIILQGAETRYQNNIVPGLSRGSLWRITLDGTIVKTVEELFTDDHIRLRKAAMSPDGKLYLLTDEDNGRIFEVVRE